MTDRFDAIQKLFHQWLKQWGGDLASHEKEICTDILQFAYDLDLELREHYARNLLFARDEGLEEAAKRVEQTQKMIGDGFGPILIPMESTAKAIRARKSKP